MKNPDRSELVDRFAGPAVADDLDTLVQASKECLSAGRFSNRDHLVQFLVEQVRLPVSDAVAITSRMADLRPPSFPKISKVELFLTDECNMDCSYCFVETKFSHRKMSDVVATKALQLVFGQHQPPPQVFLTLFGGEPFLNFPLLQNVVMAAEEQAAATNTRVRFNLTTNGTLLDEERLSFCRAHEVAILLSIDGLREAHDAHRVFPDGRGTWQATVSKIPLLRKYQPWIGAKMTIPPDQVGAALGGVRCLADLGVNQLLLGPATGIGWSAMQLNGLERELHRVASWYFGLPGTIRPGKFRINYRDLECGENEHLWGCRAGRTTVSIAADGTILPCSKIAGVKGLAEVFALGNVDDGITNNLLREILCGWRPAARVQCRRCENRTVCMGGCYATNYSATGDPFLPAPEECSSTRVGLHIAKEFVDLMRNDARSCLEGAHGG